MLIKFLIRFLKKNVLQKIISGVINIKISDGCRMKRIKFNKGFKKTFYLPIEKIAFVQEIDNNVFFFFFFN